PDAGVLVGVAGGLDEGADGVGRLGVAEHDAVNATGERLFDHPGVSTYGRLVGPVHRECRDDRRGTMAAPRGSALPGAAPEVAQAANVERVVLHVVVKVIGPRLNRLETAPEPAVLRAGVVDRLALLEHLDRAVNARHRSTSVRERASPTAPPCHSIQKM